MFSNMIRSSRLIRGALCAPSFSNFIANATVVNRSFSTSRLLLVAQSTPVKTKTKKATKTKPKPKPKPKTKTKTKTSRRTKKSSTTSSSLKSVEKKKGKRLAAREEKLAAEKEWKKDRVYVRTEGKKKYFDLKRDELPPKGAPTSWSIFLSEQLKESYKPGTGIRIFFTEAASRWASLTEDQKRVYFDKRQSIAADFERQRKEYDQKMGPKKLLTLNRYLSAKGKRRHVPSPEFRRPISGFTRFLIKFRKEHNELPLIEATQAASEQWKTMTPQEKDEYNAEYVKETLEWKKKYA